MYKMMVSDLDETLLNDDGSINELNVMAIKKVLKSGIKFVPNTGRGYLSVQNLLEELGLKNQANQYVISYNGGAIIENQDNKVIMTSGVDFSLAKKILKHGLIDATIDAHIYTVDKLYIYNISPADENYVKQRGVIYELLKTPNIDFLKNAKIMKICFETSDDKLRKEIKNTVLKEVGEVVEVTFSSQRYVEFNNKGTNKGQATLALADKLKIKPSQIIAIGDNSNDIAMLKIAGLSVGVKNAILDVKNVVDVITDKTNNEGAVAEILNKYILTTNN